MVHENDKINIVHEYDTTLLLEQIVNKIFCKYPAIFESSLKKELYQYGIIKSSDDFKIIPKFDDLKMIHIYFNNGFNSYTYDISYRIATSYYRKHKLNRILNDNK